MREVIKKILKEEDDSLSWIKDIEIDPFYYTNPGDKIMITKVTDYGYESMETCSEEDYLIEGWTYDVLEKDVLQRGDIDCSSYEPYNRTIVIGNWDDKVETIRLSHPSKNDFFWVTSEMIEFKPTTESGSESIWHEATHPRSSINESNDELGWIKSHEIKTDLLVGQLWLKYGGIDSHNSDFFLSELVSGFSNVELKGGKAILLSDGFHEFTDLYVDNDSSRYGYINKYLAESIFDDDDYWEPYYDVVYDWKEQVWGLVESNPKLLSYVVEHLKDNYVGEVEETITYEGENVPFDEKLLNHLASQNTAQLGFIIDGSHEYSTIKRSEFDDLKRELRWAYESAYNTAARDEIWVAAVRPINENFGKGEWKAIERFRQDGEPYTEHLLYFDVTNLLLENAENYFSNCFEQCRRWFDPNDYEYGEDGYGSEEEAFEEYCEECWEIDSHDFFSFYEEMLKNESEKWNPSFSEHPSDAKISEYFEEDVYNRI